MGKYVAESCARFLQPSGTIDSSFIFNLSSVVPPHVPKFSRLMAVAQIKVVYPRFWERSCMRMTFKANLYLNSRRSVCASGNCVSPLKDERWSIVKLWIKWLIKSEHNCAPSPFYHPNPPSGLSSGRPTTTMWRPASQKRCVTLRHNNGLPFSHKRAISPSDTRVQ